jgi:chaperonin GroEL
VGKRIEFDAAARAALWRGVDQLAGAVRVTLGPRGRNVVIHRRDGFPAITNDGLTIAREIELSNPFENMGVQLIKEVASQTGDAAGDGTTTATVLAHRVVGEGIRAMEAGCHPIAIKRGIEQTVAAVVEELRRHAVRVETRADIVKVATVSARYDLAIAELVGEALSRVGPQGMVTVDDGRGLETKLEIVEGMRLDRGYLSPYFVTEPESMAAVLEDALILVTDLRLTSARQILPALEQVARMKRPLVLIADDVEAEALATLVVNRLRGTLASVAVRAPATGEERRALLDDLAVLTGARLLTAEEGSTLDRADAASFGRAKRVIVDRDHTTIVEGGGDQTAIRQRIASLSRRLEASDSEYERDRLRSRLGRLAGGVAAIHVGGATELEIRDRRSRVEDALSTTRAALVEGVVVGGGVALLRAQAAVDALRLQRDEAVGRDIVRRALEEPARQIAHNAGEPGAIALERIRRGQNAFGFDALTGRYVDLIAAGIVDAAKVARCAIQNAASIGSLVLTTDAIVVDAPEDGEGEKTEEG